jgi:hypothetical protein
MSKSDSAEHIQTQSPFQPAQIGDYDDFHGFSANGNLRCRADTVRPEGKNHQSGQADCSAIAIKNENKIV